MHAQSQKDALIAHISALQETLLNIISRVEKAKSDYTSIQSENELLLEYVNNLMAATGSSTLKPKHQGSATSSSLSNSH